MQNRLFVTVASISAIVVLVVILGILIFAQSEPVIAKVGREKIYRRNVEDFLAMYPSKNKDDKLKKRLLDQLIKDSIILQAAGDQGLIELDGTFFSSAQKDLNKRFQKVEEVKNKVRSQIKHLEGSVIAIWFYNNYMSNPRLGYTEAKKLALDKITEAHNRVINNPKDIEKVAQDLLEDKEVASLDPAYKVNVYRNFNVTEEEEISKSKAFNDEMWKLKDGKVSDIYVLRLGRYDIESAYLFGYVKKNVRNKVKSFDEWYDLNKKPYEIVYY